MSLRVSAGGHRIDRTRTLRFSFDGRSFQGHPGDTLAAALLAEDQMHVGRSFKYHRPRGIVAFGAEEPNALVGIGRDGRFEPNARATVTELYDGLEAKSQNRWPSLERDVGALNAALGKLLPAGFYYKTFKRPRAFWKHVYEPFIRQAAGLGRAPTEPDPDRYEHFHAHVDVLVVGGGLAGLAAAAAAGQAGARILVLEQTPHWGGRAPADGALIDGEPASGWVKDRVEALSAMANVSLRARTTALGVYDHGYVLAVERLAQGVGGDVPRERLWKIRARRIVVAAGAIERPLSFAGNDVPGVMLAGAVRDYLWGHGVVPGRRVALVTNNDEAYRTALTLVDAKIAVPAIVDAREDPSGALTRRARAAGIEVVAGSAVAEVVSGKRVAGVRVAPMSGGPGGGREIACDAVAMSGGWSPAVHLWSHAGGKLVWDDRRAAFRPDHDRPPTGADGRALADVAGAANGVWGSAEALRDGTRAGAHAARAAAGADHGGGDTDATAESEVLPQRRGDGAGRPKANGSTRMDGDVAAPDETPLRPVWLMPQDASQSQRSRAFLDFQNDVKVSDVELAAREGFQSVEHAKRYTTLGMATDQGKLSNVNGLAILADARGEPIPEVGTTTFRPPFVPVTMGAITGEAKGALFQPVRQTQLHDWHAKNGADWEPVGSWRRPYCFRRAGEDRAVAVEREVRTARSAVGLLDASTLGKIVVKGPDAGRLLDMIYTGRMSSLKTGRCRYGLMCSDNGFLMDDGVVARLSETSWLCHTTTGGAGHVHAHMEEWIQTEWWDWRVYVADLTEAFGQIAVVGPKSRALLERLGGIDVGREALPFMGWAEGSLAGIPVRIFRISFSGELSFELAVRADRTQALWDKIMEAGHEYGIAPYGTEALHVMRAEKGFIMIGDETDGTVIPQDLGMGWAISSKKEDYLGKRAHARIDMMRPDRWRLVGLRAEAGVVLPAGAHAVAQGRNANGQRHTEGRVTSSYHSPTLGYGIALGLVERGPDRMGEMLNFTLKGGRTMRAEIVDPVFYDPEGSRQDVD